MTASPPRPLATRQPIWKSIADALAAEIAGGHYRPGDRLPTETDLATRFGVNRHTVRRAIGSLAQSGALRTRQGAGVFVGAVPTEYPLGRRVRFHQNLAASGRAASRRLTLLETRTADQREAEALDLPAGARVHVVEGVSLADGEPVAMFRSVFDALRFPGLLAQIEMHVSITRALAACSLPDYTRRDTRLTAKIVPVTMTTMLELPQGAPVLRAVSVNVDGDGRPVEYGTTWFAGDRVTLTVNQGPDS